VKIVAAATRRPVTVTVFFVALMIFGVVAFPNLPVNLLPELSFPTITVRTGYPGVAPAEVATFVSSPVEEAVGVVSGVVGVSSVSRAGLSDVVVEFAWGTDMDFAAIDIRDQLSRTGLPTAADPPILLRFDPSLDPILRLGLGSAIAGTPGPEELIGLRRIADQAIRQALESLDGVAAAVVSGGIEEEIQIAVDQRRATLLGLTISQVAARLSQENVDLTGGTIEDGNASYTVRVLARLLDIAELGRISVGQIGDAQIRLADVALITRGFKEQSTITRTDGLPTVEIAIFKEAAANTVSVAGAVRARLAIVEAEISALSPVRLRVVSDQSRFIEQAIRDVIQAALIGGGLAILVLYLFLRKLRATVVVAVAIPISVVATFFFMFLGGVSLNIMSLGGLALGIGMLVDSSIVVLESIDRHRERGLSARDAAQRGGTEVGSAVVAATLTTLCVFVPVVFVEGVAGQLFIDPALTVSFSLVVSLAVALTIIPMAASLGARTPSPATAHAVAPTALVRSVARSARLPVLASRLLGRALSLLIRPLTAGFDRFFHVVAAAYQRMLDGALRHRWLVLTVAVALLGGALALFPRLGTELIPEIRQGTLVVSVDLPPGTPVAATDATLAEMQRRALAAPQVAQTYATAGSTSAGSAEIRENAGELLIDLRSEFQGTAEDAVLPELRALLADVPGAVATFARPPLLSFDEPIEVELSGLEPDALEAAAVAVAARLRGVPGLADVTAHVSGSSPEVILSFNRDRLAGLGLTVESVGRPVADQLQGVVATSLEQGAVNVDLRVRAGQLMPVVGGAGLEELGALLIATSGDVPVPLASLATISLTQGANEVRRSGQRAVGLVTAALAGRDLGSVSTDVRAVLDEFEESFGVVAKVGGQWQEMVNSFASMQLALLLAVVLTYLVMAAQFESLLHPLIIMVAVPFGLVGVVAALLVTGVAISSITLIGVVMMAGIVVNNAIVLVDYINRLRRGGSELLDAIREAAAVRLRPILMTTATTVLGMLPLTLQVGQGWELRQPLAVTVIGGLVFSTLLTLVLIPTLYSMLAKRPLRVLESDTDDESVPQQLALQGE
jgi:HAE1 family hydrophobic/amphiphilic exporter-1